MVYGYSKVYGNSFAIIFGFGQYEPPLGLCWGDDWHNINLRLGLILINKDKKQKEGE